MGNRIWRNINLFAKRLIDIFGSLIGLIILSPVFIIIGIVIKLKSKGPILFKQERIGRNGKLFKIYKFRTMIVNAENIGDGLSINSESDTRITKLGKYLRKFSLDELPQLMNVLIGNMSLIGPRPPVVYFPYDGYFNYPQHFKKRFIMKPGITGLSQINERNQTTWEKRILMDLIYIDSFTIILDFHILFKTIIQVVRPNKIYKEESMEEN